MVPVQFIIGMWFVVPLFLVIQGTNLVHQEFAFIFFTFGLAALYVTYIFSCMCTFLDISPSLVYILVKSPKTLTFWEFELNCLVSKVIHAKYYVIYYKNSNESCTFAVIGQISAIFLNYPCFHEQNKHKISVHCIAKLQNRAQSDWA